MKTIYTLTALQLCTVTANATSLPYPGKAIFCDRNEMARDGGRNLALFRTLPDGAVQGSMVSLGNMFGSIIPRNYVTARFETCKKLSVQGIDCGSDRRAEDGALETAALTDDLGLVYRYDHSDGMSSRRLEKTIKIEVSLSDCREVTGTDLASAIIILEGQLAHSALSSGDSDRASEGAGETPNHSSAE
jgi:hypothetical protein